MTKLSKTRTLGYVIVTCLCAVIISACVPDGKSPREEQARMIERTQAREEAIKLNQIVDKVNAILTDTTLTAQQQVSQFAALGTLTGNTLVECNNGGDTTLIAPDMSSSRIYTDSPNAVMIALKEISNPAITNYGYVTANGFSGSGGLSTVCDQNLSNEIGQVDSQFLIALNHTQAVGDTTTLNTDTTSTVTTTIPCDPVRAQEEGVANHSDLATIFASGIEQVGTIVIKRDVSITTDQNGYKVKNETIQSVTNSCTDKPDAVALNIGDYQTNAINVADWREELTGIPVNDDGSTVSILCVDQLGPDIIQDAADIMCNNTISQTQFVEEFECDSPLTQFSVDNLTIQNGRPVIGANGNALIMYDPVSGLVNPNFAQEAPGTVSCGFGWTGDVTYRIETQICQKRDTIDSDRQAISQIDSSVNGAVQITEITPVRAECDKGGFDEWKSCPAPAVQGLFQTRDGYHIEIDLEAGYDNSIFADADAFDQYVQDVIKNGTTPSPWLESSNDTGSSCGLDSNCYEDKTPSHLALIIDRSGSMASNKSDVDIISDTYKECRGKLRNVFTNDLNGAIDAETMACNKIDAFLNLNTVALGVDYYNNIDFTQLIALDIPTHCDSFGLMQAQKIPCEAAGTALKDLFSGYINPIDPSQSDPALHVLANLTVGNPLSTDLLKAMIDRRSCDDIITDSVIGYCDDIDDDCQSTCNGECVQISEVIKTVDSTPNDDSDDPSREEVLIDLLDEVLVPAFPNMQQKLTYSVFFGNTPGVPCPTLYGRTCISANTHDMTTTSGQQSAASDYLLHSAVNKAGTPLLETVSTVINEIYGLDDECSANHLEIDPNYVLPASCGGITNEHTNIQDNVEIFILSDGEYSDPTGSFDKYEKLCESEIGNINLSTLNAIGQDYCAYGYELKYESNPFVEYLIDIGGNPLAVNRINTDCYFPPGITPSKDAITNCIGTIRDEHDNYITTNAMLPILSQDVADIELLLENSEYCIDGNIAIETLEGYLSDLNLLNKLKISFFDINGSLAGSYSCITDATGGQFYDISTDVGAFASTLEKKLEAVDPETLCNDLGYSSTYGSPRPPSYQAPYQCSTDGFGYFDRDTLTRGGSAL